MQDILQALLASLRSWKRLWKLLFAWQLCIVSSSVNDNASSLDSAHAVVDESILIQVAPKLVPPIPTLVTAKSYILHDPCQTTEGLGSSLQRLMPIMDVAQRFNLTYICRREDFRTVEHATGNLGFIFGCSSDHATKGNIASYEEVRSLDLRVEEARLEHVGTDHIRLNTSVRPGVVYHVQSCEKSEHWGQSYLWFRSQYHLVRAADQTRARKRCMADDTYGLETSDGQRRKNIAVAIRRGDGGNRGFKVETYIAALDKVFKEAVPGVSIKEQEANLIIVAETRLDDPEMRMFDKYKYAKVHYLLGESETDAHASRQRFLRDLDCLTTSDLILLSKGSFSSMAAALQLNGTALVLKDERHRNNMPNARYVMMQIRSETTRWKGAVLSVHVTLDSE
eukprot:TRINITY_DN64917_c0_g1_i1.p1 TRINITY_DN64917_c0_g1~~TRINITY_DN64917_c0_g1_i1.p1  ORF type:complete len:395 (+),score=65.17 TRINITY_DN64917_c0_g1_i1:89-1273(+)